MEIKNNYNIGDTAYVYDGGRIFHIIIKSIDISITPDKIEITYRVDTVNPDTSNELPCSVYYDYELCSSLDKITSIIEVL